MSDPTDLPDDVLIAEVARRWPAAAAVIRSADDTGARELVDIDRGMLTGAEVAERLGVSRRTVEGWRRTGGGPPWVRVGRGARYPAADLARWVAAGRATAAVGPPLGHRAEP